MSDWYYVIRNNVIDSVSTRPRKNVQNFVMIRASMFHKKILKIFLLARGNPSNRTCDLSNNENMRYSGITLVSV